MSSSGISATFKRPIPDFDSIFSRPFIFFYAWKWSAYQYVDVQSDHFSNRNRRRRSLRFSKHCVRTKRKENASSWRLRFLPRSVRRSADNGHFRQYYDWQKLADSCPMPLLIVSCSGDTTDNDFSQGPIRPATVVRSPCTLMAASALGNGHILRVRQSVRGGDPKRTGW